MGFDTNATSTDAADVTPGWMTHAGDCTIYSSLQNMKPTDGICTCGFGWSCVRLGDWSHMYSDEKKRQLGLI